MQKAQHGWWISVAMAAWAIACVGAYGALWSYANTPGERGGPRPHWSPPSSLQAPPDRPTLIMFAHPRCPCTQASMSELERLQGERPGAFATRVVFYEPVGADESWRQTSLWDRAIRLPDAQALPDPGGEIARAAGAIVSGCVALLGADGKLRYWGGITPARGHEGASVGSLALRSILDGKEPGRHRFEVFGCDINTPDRTTFDCADGDECHEPHPN